MLSQKNASQHEIQLAFICLLHYLGHAVAKLVEALRYKTEVCRFNSRWCREIFIDIIPQASLWPWGCLIL